MGSLPSTTKTICDKEGFCDPLTYILSRSPRRMPWIPYHTVMDVEGEKRMCVVIEPSKKSEFRGKKFLVRHCLFCGAIIDPTL